MRQSMSEERRRSIGSSHTEQWRKVGRVRSRKKGAGTKKACNSSDDAGSKIIEKRLIPYQTITTKGREKFVSEDQPDARAGQMKSARPEGGGTRQQNQGGGVCAERGRGKVAERGTVTPKLKKRTTHREGRAPIIPRGIERRHTNAPTAR